MKYCNSSLSFENENNGLAIGEKDLIEYGKSNAEYLNKRRELSPSMDHFNNYFNQQKLLNENKYSKYQNPNNIFTNKQSNIASLPHAEYESKINKIQSLPYIDRKIIIGKEEYIRDPNRNITKNYSPKNEIKKKLMAQELDKYLKLQIQIKNIRDAQNLIKNKNAISDPIFDINLNTNPRIIKDPFQNDKTGKHKSIQMNLCLKPKMINEESLNPKYSIPNSTFISKKFPESQKENPQRKKYSVFNKMNNLFNPQIASTIQKNKSFDYSTIVNNTKEFNNNKSHKKYKSPIIARNAFNINKTNDNSKIFNQMELSDFQNFKRKSNPYLGFIKRHPKKEFIINNLKRSIEKPKNENFDYFENYNNEN